MEMTFLLKVMQTVVAILTPPSPPMHQDDLARALGVCFKLRASKVTGLVQPAEASLRQIFSTILDRTWELYSEKMTTIEASSTKSLPSTTTSTDQSALPSNAGAVSTTQIATNSQQKPKQTECDLCILDATRLLRDIVYLAGGEQAVWLSLTTLDANFCLELIEEFLTVHKRLALKCPEFTSIVKDRISPLLLQLLEHRREIGFMIRLLRNCVAFVSSFHLLQPMHCVTILSSFRSLLVATQPFWVQVLMLETCRWICKDSESLLSKLVLEDDGLLRDKPQLLEAFIKFIGKLGRYVTTTVAKFELSDFVQRTTKPKFLDQLTYLDISSQMTPSHAVTISLSSFVSFIDTMAHLISPFDTSSSTYSSGSLQSTSLHGSSSSSSIIPSSKSPEKLQKEKTKIGKDSKDSSAFSAETHQLQNMHGYVPNLEKQSLEQLEAIYRVNQKICDSAWPSVLASLSVVLSKTRDESLIQSSLKAYQSFTNTLGVLKLSGPRGAFLDSLVRFSLPFALPSGSQSSQSIPNQAQNLNQPYSTPSQSTGPSGAQNTLTNSQTSFQFSLLAEEEYKSCKFTKKNIAAMKTVLNVAHCMGSILDNSWNTMVETLNHLNGILACTRRVRNVSVIMSSSSTSSFGSTGSGGGALSGEEVEEMNLTSSGSTQVRGRTTAPAVSQYDLNTQDAAIAAQDWPTREEIDILDSALDSLFTTSVYVSDAGFVDFSRALIALSYAQFAAIGENAIVKPFALFGFSSLMKLLRHNVRRASLVWTEVHKHALQACNSPNHAARQIAVRAICGTIEESISCISRPPYASMNHEDPIYVSMLLMQVRYLETTEALVDSRRYEATRVEILESLFRILQHSGSSLSTGWPVVLAILLNIGVSNEISLIPLGFKSVQQITNEYLTAIPYDCLPVTISTIGNFGGKSIADININIAAIGLLWNVADFIARKQSDILLDVQTQSESSETKSSQSPHDSSNNGNNSKDDGRESPASEQNFRENSSDSAFSSGSAAPISGQTTYVDSLWLALFQELAARVDNSRSEIRDCALATLYGILTTYGSSLNTLAWQSLLDKLLLPSLPWVLKQVIIATREPDDKESRDAMTATTNLGPQMTNYGNSGVKSTISGISGPQVTNSGISGPKITTFGNSSSHAQQTSQQSSSISTSSSQGQINVVPSSNSNQNLSASASMNNSHSSAHLSSVSTANIVIHHSRNTLAKQWQETQISLISNFSRVFKAFLKTKISNFSANFFEKLYTTFLDHVEIFAKNTTLEVAIQCVSAVRDLLIAVYAGVDSFHFEKNPNVATPTGSLSGSCYELEKYAWRTWQRISSNLGATRMHARLVGNFSESLEEIYGLLVKKECDALRIERLVSVMQPLLYLPLELAGEYTVLHKQVFPIFASFALPASQYARYALPLIPKLVSMCLTYISNAIGLRYLPSCYCLFGKEICHQLDVQIPGQEESLSSSNPRNNISKLTKNSFVSDRGSWNVNQTTLEKNFFNLAEKSILLLQQIWEGLVSKEYANTCENLVSQYAFDIFEGRGNGNYENEKVSPADAFLTKEEIQLKCQQISLQVFPDISSVLGHAIQVKPLDARAKFWSPCLDLFMRSIRETLSTISITPSSTESQNQPLSQTLIEGQNQENSVQTEISLQTPVSSSHQGVVYTNIEINIIWTGIIDSIESFLMVGGGSGANESSMGSGGFGSHYSGSMSVSNSPGYGSLSSSGMSLTSSSESMSGQASEARLVELLSHYLLFICPNLPNLHDRLFQILIDGCEVVSREALMKQCYASLFDAVHVSNKSSAASANSISIENRMSVARLALPQLMKRCKNVLSKFIADDKRSGALPLPSARVVEVTYLLEQLKTLRIDPSLWENPAKTLSDSPRRHLWELFPLLCECITAKEAELKNVVKSVFQECGQELGLEL